MKQYNEDEIILILNYDSWNENRYLTIYDRCEFHRLRSSLHKKKPYNLSKELIQKGVFILIEIHERNYQYQHFQYKEDPKTLELTLEIIKDGSKNQY